MLLMFSMFIGGGSGSTAGGIKLLRLLIILRLVQYYLRRVAMPPHAVVLPRLSRRVLDRDERDLALLIAAALANACSASAGRPAQSRATPRTTVTQLRAIVAAE